MPIRSKKNNEFEDDTPLAELTEMPARLLELVRRLPDGPDFRSPTSTFSQTGLLPVKFLPDAKRRPPGVRYLVCFPQLVPIPSEQSSRP